MTGPMAPGWYRSSKDGPNQYRKVIGGSGGFFTCLFDSDYGGPCDGGRALTPELWRTLRPVAEPTFVPA